MTPANTRHPAETDADYTYLFDSIYIWRKKKKQEEEQETHMDPMIDIRVTRRAIRNHTKDARLHGSIDYCIGLMMMMMFICLAMVLGVRATRHLPLAGAVALHALHIPPPPSNAAAPSATAGAGCARPRPVPGPGHVDVRGSIA